MTSGGRIRADSSSSNGSVFSNDYDELPYYYKNFKDSNESRFFHLYGDSHFWDGRENWSATRKLQRLVADFLKHKSKNKPGCFLVRPSFKRPNCLTVSVVVKDKSVRHTNIVIETLATCRQYYLVPEKKFPTVADLIIFYGENEVKNLEKVNNVRFLYPISRNTSRYSDYSGGSSGGSFTLPYPEQQPQEQLPQPDNPPRLPPRPNNLPRRPSGSSFGSQSSLQRNPSDTSPMGGPPFGSALSLPRNISQNGLSQRGMSVDNFNPADRPPVPVPAEAQPPGSHRTVEKDPYYSHPRNTEEDISERLKEVLRQNERCDCGIPRDMSDLPMGWTLHRSKDQPTYGRIFFQNSVGITSWKLPEDVQRKLSAEQNANLKKLQFIYKRHLSTNYLLQPDSGSDNTRF